MTPYFFEWPATDDHLIAIGKVVIESACVEQHLQMAIWQILDLPEEKASYITGHLHLDGRLTLFQEVAPSFFPETAHDELNEKIAALRDANTERNLIIHGLWEPGKDSPTNIHKYKKEKGVYALRYKNFTPEKIELIAKQIADANRGLVTLLNKHGLRPPVPPRTPSRPY